MERNAPLFEASPSLDQPREFFLSLGGAGGSLRNQVDREGGAGQDRTRVNSLEDGTDLGGMDGVNLGDRVHRSTLGSTPMDGSLALGYQANETGQPDTLKGMAWRRKEGHDTDRPRRSHFIEILPKLLISFTMVSMV